jgi:hypothetical protein
MQQISTELKSAMLGCVLTWLGSGAKVQVYGSAQPDFGATVSDTPLVAIPLQSPAGVVSGGVLTLSKTDEVMVTTAGTAVWARIINSDGVIGMDVAVSANDGGAPLQLSSLTLYAGGYLRLLSGTLS